MAKPEPLMADEEQRYVLYPIRHKDIWDMYKKQLACLWLAEELDFQQDITDWDKLTDNERHFLKYILAFFAGSDGIVMSNISERFLNDVTWLEAQICYGFQQMMEGIHSEVYSLMIDTFIKDEKEKTNLFEAMETIPCIRKKADWSLKWIGSLKATFPERLIAFACVEGIFFSGAFCSIFWLKQKGLMPGLCTSNEFISRDEGLHTDFACLLYSKIKNRVPVWRLKEIVKDAVKIEKEFICDALPCRLLGMNADLMSQYIEYVADRLVVQLGYKKIYHTPNPFDFMERLSLESKSNFFEKRVSEYAKTGVGRDKEEMSFGLDGEF